MSFRRLSILGRGQLMGFNTLLSFTKECTTLMPLRPVLPLFFGMHNTPALHGLVDSSIRPSSRALSIHCFSSMSLA